MPASPCHSCKNANTSCVTEPSKRWRKEDQTERSSLLQGEVETLNSPKPETSSRNHDVQIETISPLLDITEIFPPKNQDAVEKDPDTISAAHALLAMRAKEPMAAQ